MIDLLVVPAEMSHALGMAEVVVGAWQTSYRGIVPNEVLQYLDVERRASRWREQIQMKMPKQEIYAAVVDGLVVGAAICGERRKGPEAYDGELQTIYVRPSHHRKGIGRALFEECVRCQICMGYSKMIIWTLSQNQNARRFYEEMGGSEIAKSRINVGGYDLPETAYGWNLSSFERDSQPLLSQ